MKTCLGCAVGKKFEQLPQLTPLDQKLRVGRKVLEIFLLLGKKSVSFLSI